MANKIYLLIASLVILVNSNHLQANNLDLATHFKAQSLAVIDELKSKQLHGFKFNLDELRRFAENSVSWVFNNESFIVGSDVRYSCGWDFDHNNIICNSLFLTQAPEALWTELLPFLTLHEVAGLFRCPDENYQIVTAMNLILIADKGSRLQQEAIEFLNNVDCGKSQLQVADRGTITRIGGGGDWLSLYFKLKMAKAIVESKASLSPKFSISDFIGLQVEPNLELTNLYAVKIEPFRIELSVLDWIPQVFSPTGIDKQNATYLKILSEIVKARP